MIISLVVAMDENRVIGAGNKLPWKLPRDMRRFRRLTRGQLVIMGRKTYESIGEPLPDRVNIILTRDVRFSAQAECIVVHSLTEALVAADGGGYDEVMVIGGANVYEQFLARAQRIYLTTVHHAFEGDAYFPQFDESEWEESDQEHHKPDANNPYSCTFVTLNRKSGI